MPGNRVKILVDDAVRTGNSTFGLKSLVRNISAANKLRRKFRKYDRMVFLGNILATDDIRRDYSLAYHHPERAMAEMDEYLWAVPAIPTPFVGEAPAPGRYGAAIINSQQFRHPVDLVVPKPRDLCRIFFTGSSTAFCSGAPDDETTITGYLQKMLNDNHTSATGRSCEVVNASHAGWASSYERLWIEMRLSEMQPDVVIQFSGNNDAHWGARHFPVDWMRSYHEQLYYLIAAAWYRLFGKAELVDIAPREAGLVPPERVARTLLKNVRQLMCMLPEQQVHYIFILQPTLSETRKPLSDREARLRSGDETIDYFNRCYREMRKLLEPLLSRFEATAGNRLFSYLDYSDVFDGCSQAQEVFMDSYHFGDRGNELIAARLYQDLKPLIDQRYSSSPA
jgi:lysophospholipase L1-like esterase